MVYIEYSVGQFLTEVEKALDEGLLPLPAINKAIHTIGKPYLLKAETITISGWPLGSVNASGKFRDKIFVTRNGDTYIKKYYRPTDRKTDKQVSCRNKFKAAIAKWQRMTPEQREEWRIIALNEQMAGYNLFIKTAMKRR